MANIKSFAKASLDLDFATVNRAFLPYLPKAPSMVLDLGAGVGQNSAAMAKLGHHVVAIEPLQPFIDIAQSTYQNLNITWYCDSLPKLGTLASHQNAYSFILIDGVWQHIDTNERQVALMRIASLLNSDGVCAISLRHGPSRVAPCVFSNSVDEISAQAEKAGLTCRILSTNQPSLMPNKLDVTWDRVILSFR